jgi:hypothetical protein
MSTLTLVKWWVMPICLFLGFVLFGFAVFGSGGSTRSEMGIWATVLMGFGFAGIYHKLQQVFVLLARDRSQ